MNTKVLWMAVALLACGSCDEPRETTVSRAGVQSPQAFQMTAVVDEAPASPAAVGVSGNLMDGERMMPVRGGFATWDSRSGWLEVTLLPFEVTPDEAESMSRRHFHDVRKWPNPDPAVFELCPYGRLRFMFSDKTEPSFAGGLSVNIEYQGFVGRTTTTTILPPMSDAFAKQLAACTIDLEGEAVIAIKGSYRFGERLRSWSIAARLPVLQK